MKSEVFSDKCNSFKNALIKNLSTKRGSNSTNNPTNVNDKSTKNKTQSYASNNQIEQLR